jgi:hypothetical protein
MKQPLSFLTRTINKGIRINVLLDCVHRPRFQKLRNHNVKNHIYSDYHSPSSEHFRVYMNKGLNNLTRYRLKRKTTFIRMVCVGVKFGLS